MKWLSLTKDDCRVISVNKLKDDSIVQNRINTIAFVHKKNNRKGKFQTIELKGPYYKTQNPKNGDRVQWIFCYLEPINKNHQNSEWTLQLPDGTKQQVFNGAILIHTAYNLENNTLDYPKINTGIDVSEKDGLMWQCEHNEVHETNSISQNFVNLESKESNHNISEEIQDNDSQDEEDEERDDEDEDDEIAYGHNKTIRQHKRITEDDDNDDEIVAGEDEEDDVEPDDEDSVLVKKIDPSIAITLQDDLGALQTQLAYEPYDYEATIIPSHKIEYTVSN